MPEQFLWMILNKTNKYFKSTYSVLRWLGILIMIGVPLAFTLLLTRAAVHYDKEK